MNLNDLMMLSRWRVFVIIFPSVSLNTLIRSWNIEGWEYEMNVLPVLVAIIGLIILFSWISAIGIFLSEISENPYRPNKYLLIIAAFLCFFQYALMQLSIVNLDQNQDITLILMPFAFLSLFYLFTRTAKSLKSIELGEEAVFSDYILDSFLLFMWPVGLWFIQPRLNVICKVKLSVSNN